MLDILSTELVFIEFEVECRNVFPTSNSLIIPDYYTVKTFKFTKCRQYNKIIFSR